MAIGDFFEVRDFQQYLGQEVINVYHYRQLTDPGLGEGAALAHELTVQWYAALGSMVTAIQSVALNHVRTESVMFNSFTSFDVTANGDNGQVSGDALPSFVAWKFFLSRLSREVRNGQKRVAGVPESLQVNGLPTTGAFTAAEPYRLGLESDLDVAGIPTWRPVILRVPTDGSPPTLYSEIAEARFEGTTTQNTRKIGRGA